MKEIEELVERVATYLEQYSKDVRALHRNPNHWECENTAKELLTENPDLALIDRTVDVGILPFRDCVIPLADALKEERC